MNWDITRPWLTLDAWQKKYIWEKPMEDNFLLTSRQNGKTTAMSIKSVELCVHHFKKGEMVLIASLTEKQGYHMLAKALSYAQEIYPNKVILHGKDKPTKHRIVFTNKTEILCYAAGDTGQGLRGFTIKKLMIDEGSRMSEEFFAAVSPMLSVIQGSMDIASTPAGAQGFFFQCSKEDSGFIKHFAGAEDNPRHTKEHLAKERKRMSSLRYAQEYEARFLDDLRQLYPDKLIRKLMLRKREKVIGRYRKYFLGVDVARMGEDESTFEILDRTNRKKIVHIDNITTKKTLTTDSTRMILELNERYNFKGIWIDDGGMGVGVFDQLLDNRKTKWKVRSMFSESRELDAEKKKKKKIKKAEVHNNLLMLMEQEIIELLDDEEVFQSLKSIQYEYTDTGEFKVDGNNAHIADGLAYAAWCAKDKSLNIMAFCK